jgi:hypothetical protein
MLLVQAGQAFMHGLESIRLCGIMTLACGHGSLLLHLHFSQGHNTKRCSVLPVYSHSLTLAALLKEQHQHAQNTHTSKRLGVARDSQKIATHKHAYTAALLFFEHMPRLSASVASRFTCMIITPPPN